MVINLLSNALKFSKASDVIEVKLGMASVGSKGEVELKIEVKDKGIGIAAHEQELIFEPFYRSPNTNSSGHGIGLSICRRLMEKLQGTISVESRLGCGSTFTLWFKTKRFDNRDSKTLTMDGSKSILRAHKERINSAVLEKTSSNLQSYGRLLPRVEEDQLEQ